MPMMRKRSNSSDEIHYSPGRMNRQKLSISTNNMLWYHKQNNTSPGSSSSRSREYSTQNAVWSLQSPRNNGPNRLTVQALASPTSNRRALDIRNSRRKSGLSSSSTRTAMSSSSSSLNRTTKMRSSKRRSNTTSVDSVQDLLNRL